MTKVQKPRITLDQLRQTLGGAPAVSDWVAIDQAMIDDFARVTGDAAFIHVDPVRAQATPFGGTIAHGLLTLSLLPQLMKSAVSAIEGMRMGVNYGFDQLRFIAPVPVDSRVRARVRLVELREARPRFHHLTYDVAVEIEGAERPAIACRWIVARWEDG